MFGTWRVFECMLVTLKTDAIINRGVTWKTNSGFSGRFSVERLNISVTTLSLKRFFTEEWMFSKRTFLMSAVKRLKKHRTSF